MPSVCEVDNRFDTMQQHAYDLIMGKGNHNVCILGGGGTGKSYVVKQAIKDLENSGVCVSVCAPTGIAALNLGGKTIHKLIYSRNGSIQLHSSNVVIVDEISMCRSDLFADLVRAMPKECRLVVVGDFYQLPPVVKRDESVLFKDGREFAFTRPEWERMDFEVVNLTEVHRQTDFDMKEALNAIRCGYADRIGYFNNALREPDRNAVTIVSTNAKASAINNSKLAELPGNQIRIRADYFGTVTPETTTRLDEEILLKPGARVIMLMNDASDKPAYVNGTQGTFVGFKGEAAIIKGDDNHEFKVFPQRETVEETVPVEHLVFDKDGKIALDANGRKQTYTTFEKKEVGAIEQYPFRLGWAITIHKSQGMTLETANVDPDGIFADGQLYVALSRVRSMDGLHLLNPIKGKHVKTNQYVAKFMDSVAMNQHRLAI